MVVPNLSTVLVITISFGGISPKFQKFQLFWDRKKKLNLTIGLMDQRPRKISKEKYLVVLYNHYNRAFIVNILLKGSYLLLFMFHILQLNKWIATNHANHLFRSKKLEIIILVNTVKKSVKFHQNFANFGNFCSLNFFGNFGGDGIRN